MTQYEILITGTYAIYLALSIFITVWVGRTLHGNGRLFLVENFHRNEALADSVNHLLLVGFYLVNIGFVALALKYGDKPTNIYQAVEFLSTKVGLVIVVLGAMHFFNIYVLTQMRNFSLVRTTIENIATNKGV